jgi:hypothetical protein
MVFASRDKSSSDDTLENDAAGQQEVAQRYL